MKQAVSLPVFMVGIVIAVLVGSIAGKMVGMRAVQPTVSPSVSANASAAIFDALNDQMSGWPTVAKLPAGAREVAKLPQSICPPDPDGPCGYDFIFSDSNDSLYVTVQGGAITVIYGPIGKTSEILPDVTAVSHYVKTLEF